LQYTDIYCSIVVARDLPTNPRLGEGRERGTTTFTVSQSQNDSDVRDLSFDFDVMRGYSLLVLTTHDDDDDDDDDDDEMPSWDPEIGIWAPHYGVRVQSALATAPAVGLLRKDPCYFFFGCPKVQKGLGRSFE